MKNKEVTFIDFIAIKRLPDNAHGFTINGIDIRIRKNEFGEFELYISEPAPRVVAKTFKTKGEAMEFALNYVEDYEENC
jgi:hypothetical protein